jgi:hypothetical protein
VAQRTSAARRDGRLEDGVHLRGGDVEAVAEALEAVGERALARNQAIEPRQQRVEVRIRVVRRRSVVQCLGFLIEAHLLPGEHTRPRGHRAELHPQVLVPQANQRVAVVRNAVPKDRDERLRRGTHLGDTERLGVRERLERVGAVVCVDVTGIAVPETQR